MRNGPLCNKCDFFFQATVPTKQKKSRLDIKTPGYAQIVKDS